MPIIETDVLVIGGGLIGTSVAYYLSKHGADVVLLESNDLASGTSSACEGGVSLHSKRSGILLKLTRLSIDLYRDLSAELGYDIEYEQDGGMVLVENEEQWSFMEEFVDIQQKAGVKVQLVDASEVTRIQPNLSKWIVGAAIYPEDGMVNPLCLTFGFARAAKRKKAKVFLNTRVEGIERASSKMHSVQTNRGKIKSKFVVNAAGVNAPQIGKMVGVEIPITPLKGQLVVTESIPRPFTTSSVVDSDYLLTKFAHVSQPQKTKDKLPVSFTAFQMRNGNFIFGSTKESLGYNRQTTAEGITAIVQGAVKFLPGLSNIHLIRTFAGLRPQTPDGLPILGEAEETEGFILAAGHGGDGVALTPITGKLIAELIIEGRPSVDISELRLSRFAHRKEN